MKQVKLRAPPAAVEAGLRQDTGPKKRHAACHNWIIHNKRDF